MKPVYIRVSDPKPNWKRIGWYCQRCARFETPQPYDFLPGRKGTFRCQKPKGIGEGFELGKKELFR